MSATCRPLSSTASSIEDTFVGYLTGIVWGAGYRMTLLRRCAAMRGYDTGDDLQRGSKGRVVVAAET